MRTNEIRSVTDRQDHQMQELTDRPTDHSSLYNHPADENLIQIKSNLVTSYATKKQQPSSVRDREP